MRKKLSLFLVLTILISTFSVFATTAFAVTAPEISCSAAYVLDFDTGEELYSYNATVTRVPASMTKLLTMYIIAERLQNGTIQLSDQVPISYSAQSLALNSYYSNVPLYTSGYYTVDELIDAMLVASACGATYALAEYISGSESEFVNLMNQTLSDLGISGHFYDSYGVSASNYISARGIAQISYYLINTWPYVLTYTAKASVYFHGYTYYNTNELVKNAGYYYYGADGLKTGQTSAAGSCLTATAARDGRRIIVVVMNSQDRFSDAANLLDYGFACRPTPDVTEQYPEERGTEIYQTAMQLHNEGLMLGMGAYSDGSPYFGLGLTLTRAQAVTLLVRLMGLEGTAKSHTWETPFEDAIPDWAKPYVGCAYYYGLVKGITTTQFGSDVASSPNMYLTFCVRALGYEDGVDFEYKDVLSFASNIGLGTYSSGATFTRANAVAVTAAALAKMD